MLTTQNADRSKLPPLMLQYAQIKDQYPNDVVLIRVGDFFEAYFEDAVHMSSFGDIRLTAKRVGSKKDKEAEKDFSATESKYTTDEIINSQILIPLSGVPHKHLKTYAQKLIAMGKRVVVIEQMEDPKTVTKGLVKREVVKIMSTIEKDDDYLSSDANNFLCVIFEGHKEYGLCFADVSTGDIFLTTVDSIDAILNELASHKPNELVLTKSIDELLGNEIENKLKLNPMRTIEERVFELDDVEQKILSCFNLSSISEIKFHSDLEKNCLYALINYIEYTERLSFNFELLPVCYDFDNYMSIDMYSRSNLELTESLSSKTQAGTLLSVLNHCKTSMGTRMLRQWIDKPLLNKSKIEQRLEGISELILDKKELEEIQNSMFGILDISRIMGRLKLNRSIPRDLVNLRESLKKLPRIYEHLGNYNSTILKELHDNMITFDDLTFLLDKAILDDPASDIKEGAVIKAGYSTNLDNAHDMIFNSNKYLSKLEESERDKTGIKSLRLVNKNGKCTLEVSRTYYDKVPDYYVVEKALKQSTRYITSETEKLEKDLYSAIERSKSIEIELYEELKCEILKENQKLTELCNVIATFDALCSLAYTAITSDYVKPELNENGSIHIVDGRHPVVEKFSSKKFVANDINMDMCSNNFILLTGPNMAGKSTYMRQTALITIMAHIGSFVPATSANISITDKIFTRIGASDDISSGRSTYMVEMVEVKNILDNATSKSLILLDEVGRGTSTSDGLAIAQALSEYIYNHIGCKTLFATHYHELIALENSLDGLKNFHMSVEKENGSLNFIRKIEEGGLSESYGIDVASMAGIPEVVINRAWDILNHIEGHKTEVSDVQKNTENFKLLDFVKNIDRGNLSPISAYKLVFDLLEIADSM